MDELITLAEGYVQCGLVRKASEVMDIVERLEESLSSAPTTNNVVPFKRRRPKAVEEA